MLSYVVDDPNNLIIINSALDVSLSAKVHKKVNLKDVEYSINRSDPRFLILVLKRFNKALAVFSFYLS